MRKPERRGRPPPPYPTLSNFSFFDMLLTLNIRDFVIVSQLELDFTSGLVVITGETGAGKSIIINALKLLLGAKATTDMVRNGANEAIIQARFSIDKDSPQSQTLQEIGVQTEDEEFIVRRVIQSNGRNRIYINNSLQTLTTLRETMRGVMDISGQHDHVSLLDPNKHLEILDRYADCEELLKQYKDLHKNFIAIKSEQTQLQNQLNDRAKRLDYINFQIEELQKFAPKIGQELLMEEELKQLAHAESIQCTINQCLDKLYDADDNMLSDLSKSVSELSRAQNLLQSLTPVVELLTQAQILIQEAVHSLRNIDLVQHDPKRIDALQSKLQIIDKLKRKFARSADELMPLLEQLCTERDELELSDERLRKVQTLRTQTRDQLLELALKLHQRRQTAASLLQTQASAILQDLAMQNASISVHCKMGTQEQDLRADGADNVEFFLSSNLGQEPKPLAKIASGGELSRVLLAFKRVLVIKDSVGVYVFDEVDSGIGGMTASNVANALLELSLHKQVLCITHLASIACHAEQHFQVSKSVVGDSTLSAIVELNQAQRVEEIARMLGGLRVTDKTLAHAADLLEQAQNVRKKH